MIETRNMHVPLLSFIEKKGCIFYFYMCGAYWTSPELLIA